jgi:hypothetical protein
MRAVLFALSIVTLARPAATQECSKNATLVQRWFAALERKDFRRAIAMTEGAAQTRTEHITRRLLSEAAAHHADVEVKVKRLEVGDDGDAVHVTFDIDIIGKKWFFRRVARNLSGTARFTVAKIDPRITAIDGRLE